MSLAKLLNVAYVLLTERLDEEARGDFDRRLAGFSGPAPERSRRAQSELMGAMELGRR